MSFDKWEHVCSQHSTRDIGYFYPSKESLFLSVPILPYSTTALISFTIDEFYLFLNFTQMESFSIYFFVYLLLFYIFLRSTPIVACISSSFFLC